MPERTVPHPLAFRLVLIPLALVQLIDGVWALFFPRSFYDDFPAGRGGWVAALPEYSEHLVRDVGSLFLATAVLLAVAAWRLERRFVAVTLVAWLCWALPHTVWHFFNLGVYDTTDAVGNAVTLTLTVAGPLALLALLARTPRLAAPRGAAAAPANGAARIAGVDRPRNPVVRGIYGQTKRQFGRVLEPVRLMAHAPVVLSGYGAMELATEHSHHMDERLKELAVMRAAQMAGCEWCLDFGSAIVRAKGVSDDDLRALLDWRDSDVLSDDDKLVVEYAEAMSRTPVEVPDELFERLRARFDEPAIVDLTSVIAMENYRARFNWALGIGSEGFSEGAYCAPPAGVASGPGAAAPHA